MSDCLEYKSWPSLTYKDTVFSSIEVFDHNSTNSTVRVERSWMHEDIKNKNNLLVAIGDSWTWGDSLFNIRAGTHLNDHPDRTKVIYGAKLSEMLSADFINLGHCGGTNEQMLYRLSKVLSFNTLKYDKIYVIITLTENCRGIAFRATDSKLPAVYKNSDFWIEPINDDTHHNFYEFLRIYEKNLFLKFKKIFQQDDYKNVKFLIGRNFTYSFDENIEILKDYHLEKTWIDCLNQYQNNSYNYPKDLRMLSTMAFQPIEQYFKSLKFFDFVIADLTLEMEKGKKAIDWLDNSPLNHKKYTRHPTIDAHNIWANYVYEKFMNGVK